MNVTNTPIPAFSADPQDDSDILAAHPFTSILIMPLEALRSLLEQDTCSMTIMADRTGVLLDLRNESLLTFNETGVFMIERIKQGDNPAAIVAQVIATYQVDEATAQADVSVFVEQLAQALGCGQSVRDP